MEKWQDKRTYNHINVPVEMCNYAVRHNLENPLRVFIYLKINYPSGKIYWNIKVRKRASLFLKINIKTIDNNFKKIIELEWVEYYEKFNYCRLISFDKLRCSFGWYQTRSFSFNDKNILNIRSTLGGVLYTQLFKSYSRKYLKRNKKVLKNGSAISFITPSCKYADYAQISVKSISKIFHTSISKAVRLKQKAEKAGYLKVKKQYMYLNDDQIFAAMKGREYSGENNNVVCIKGKYAYQGIDKIYSEMYFKKRKKLKTL